jgi:hypothetical protein
MLIGCGGSGLELAQVGGRVTLDGQPLGVARLMFQPEGLGSPSYGTTDSDGRYVLGYKRGVKGAMIGWHRISIQVESGTRALPARYNTKTELRREVAPGDNVLDFELTSDP